MELNKYPEKDLDPRAKIKQLVYFQYFVWLIIFFIESYRSKEILHLMFFFQLIFMTLLFNFYYQSLKNLYYSFWNISFIFLIAYFFIFFRNTLIWGDIFLSILAVVNILILLLTLYVMSSPIYFPRVHWWEYDFRYRPDLSVEAEYGGDRFKARLSDLRRGAGCIEMFQNFSVGDNIRIFANFEQRSFNLYAKIQSKKQPIIGRTIVYGVSFLASDLEEKQRLKLLTNLWLSNKNEKIKLKFKEIIS